MAGVCKVTSEIKNKCLVESCKDERWIGQSIYCKIHANRNSYWKLSTPVLECDGCNNTFVWDFLDKPFWIMDGRGSRSNFCQKCIDTINSHEYYIDYGYLKRIKKYGITIIDYINLLVSQNYTCLFCDKKEGYMQNGKRRSLEVDHDHKCCSSDKCCGKCVRGLVCMSCNLKLGYIEKDMEATKQMVEYIMTGGKFLGVAY